MKGYKVFHPDWTCRGYQYKVGEIFEEDVAPSCCKCGFHFCKDLKKCFDYYSFDPKNKVAEIEALGVVDVTADGRKFCTNKIKIIREITWEEVLRIVNEGEGCTGFGNIGNYNTGSCNEGNLNSGNCNKGDCNSGNYNCGRNNSGESNVGDYNTGSFNKGSFNTGYDNIGDHNSGTANKGIGNNGRLNMGNYNSGDWNRTNYSNGCFNTEESKIFMFNKLSNWTLRDWYNSLGSKLLAEIRTTNDYLKECDDYSNNQAWWNHLNKKEKDAILNLPNFDKKIFKKITGINAGV